MVAWIVLGVVSGSSWGSSRATVLSVWPPHWHARCARALVACVLSDVLPQEEMGCTRFRVALFALASLGLPNLRLKLSHCGVKLSHRGPGPPQLSPGYRMLAPRSPRLASRSATLTTGYPNLASPMSVSSYPSLTTSYHRLSSSHQISPIVRLQVNQCWLQLTPWWPRVSQLGFVWSPLCLKASTLGLKSPHAWQPRIPIVASSHPMLALTLRSHTLTPKAKCAGNGQTAQAKQADG